MKKIGLEKLLEESGTEDYQLQYEYVAGLIKGGKIRPIGSAPLNGKKPALPAAFWLTEEAVSDPAEVEELRYDTELMISTDYYLHHPEVYHNERKWVRELNSFLRNGKSSLECAVSLNERSCQIWGREKFLQREQGIKLLKHCGMTVEELNVYRTSEPLAYYSADKSSPQGILIIENKDTFYTFRHFLYEGGRKVGGHMIGTVIYGAGKGILKSFSDVLGIMDEYMRDPGNEYLYFGDIDYEGIGIYEHLATDFRGMCVIRPFEHCYKLMLHKAHLRGFDKLELTKAAQNRNISGEFFKAFSPEVVSEMKAILESGRYIPQEYVNITDLA